MKELPLKYKERMEALLGEDFKEYEKALAWTKAKCIEGLDKNPEYLKKTAAEKEEMWEFVVKMMVIIKDMMNGNPNLPEGCEEEMVGHNAIAAGFQGQRQWTDFYPNCDFPEAMLNTSFDWNGAREPYILATENDVLNGIGMLFMKLLTNRAQMFSDVRTYWSPEACKRASGYDIDGVAKENGGFIQVGYSAERFQRDIDEFVIGVTRNRHVGEGGAMIIVDEDGNVKYYTYDSDAVIANGKYGEYNRRVLEQLGEI